MAGASANHNRIAGNLYARMLGNAGRDCSPFIGDMKLRLEAGRVFYYPDVMLVCDEQDNDAYFKTAPCLIAEVLSPATESIDRREKLIAYQRLPSLREYLLIAQDRIQVEIYRRTAMRHWTLTTLGAGDTLELTCIALALPLAELYRGADFSQAA
jgi:Uma2 family endonuclease